MRHSETPLAPRILVADDTRDTADIYCLLLSSAGYRMARAYDGLTAMALAKASKPDLAILNFLMPGTTGLEVLQELRAAGSRTKVIITSGASREQFARLAASAEAAGAHACLRLPLGAPELLGAVADALPLPRP